MTDQELPLHIVELRTENVKRISAVTIRPEGNMVVIGGDNGQGKTSLLDSIEWALGGSKNIDAEPIRRGARKAKIVVNLGEIVVERTFNAKGGTSLVVKNADGEPMRSPQALMDKLCAKVTFDPLSFAREDDKKQDAILKDALGLDFSKLDAKRQGIFDQRRDLKRDAKALGARLDAMVLHINVPEKEDSVAALTEELETAQNIAKSNDAKRSKIKSEQKFLETLETQSMDAKNEVNRIEAELSKARLKLQHTHDERESQKLLLEQLESEADALVDPDTAPIKEKLRTIEETNRKVRENAEHKKLSAELEDLETQIEKHTESIQGIDDEKARQLEAADFPIPGLGFDETGPTLNGVPLSQASQAERLRVSIAIGAALNPRVRVMLVRDAALLDQKSMQLLAEFAAEKNVQIWLERVGDGDESAIIIDDGTILTHGEAAE